MAVLSQESLLSQKEKELSQVQADLRGQLSSLQTDLAESRGQGEAIREAMEKVWPVRHSTACGSPSLTLCMEQLRELWH